MKKLKYSRQREAIKEFLLSRDDHPTADTIYENLRKEFPNISLGTVYRNMNLLVETNEAIKLSSKLGPDRYDAKMAPHYHFVCQKCEGVKDLVLDGVIDLEEKAASNLGAIITAHDLSFYGICSSCK